jgi:amidohydrolase
MNQDQIKKVIADHHDTVISWRRRIHQYPDLGLRCDQTAKLVEETLLNLGLDVKTGFAMTGIAANLHGISPQPLIGLRVDMDALPIQEETGLTFTSKIENRMHACGHDAHTAIGLGVAAVLGQMKDEIPGTVKFIFQPGEEAESGAKNMIIDGVLKDSCPDAFIGLHVDPLLESGAIGICFGPTMAGTVEFELKIRGEGGHAAQPQTCQDSIAAAGHIITLIQTVLSRGIDPLHPVVLSFGEISGGFCHNTIPDQVILKGTFRFLEDDTESRVFKSINDTINGVSTVFGVDVSLKVIDRIPPLTTDPDLSALLIEKATERFRRSKICRLDSPTMLGEDFSEFSSLIPSVFLRIGCHDLKKGHTQQLHHPKFSFDERILLAGIEMTAFTIITLLEKLT